MTATTGPRRHLFIIPESLYVASLEAAQILYGPEQGEGNFSEYARTAIGLLGGASIQRFNTRDTKLLVEGTEIQIPSLITPHNDRSAPKHRVNITMDDQTAHTITDHARRIGISKTERLQRSLRFANFVVAHCNGQPPAFTHKGARKRLYWQTNVLV